MKLSKFLKSIVFPFDTSERSETHQLHSTNLLHAKPLLQFQSLDSCGYSLLLPCVGQVPQALILKHAKEGVW